MRRPGLRVTVLSAALTVLKMSMGKRTKVIPVNVIIKRMAGKIPKRSPKMKLPRAFGT